MFCILHMAGLLQRSQLGEKQLLLQLQGLQEELRPELQVNHSWKTRLEFSPKEL